MLSSLKISREVEDHDQGTSMIECDLVRYSLM